MGWVLSTFLRNGLGWLFLAFQWRINGHVCDDAGCMCSCGKGKRRGTRSLLICCRDLSPAACLHEQTERANDDLQRGKLREHPTLHSYFTKLLSHRAESLCISQIKYSLSQTHLRSAITSSFSCHLSSFPCPTSSSAVSYPSHGPLSLLLSSRKPYGPPHACQVHAGASSLHP